MSCISDTTTQVPPLFELPGDVFGEYLFSPHCVTSMAAILILWLDKDITDKDLMISQCKSVIKQLQETNKEIINKQTKQVCHILKFLSYDSIYIFKHLFPLFILPFSSFPLILKSISSLSSQPSVLTSKQMHALKEHFDNLRTCVDMREISRQKLELSSVKLKAEFAKVIFPPFSLPYLECGYKL